MYKITLITLYIFSFLFTSASPLHIHYKHSIIVSTDCSIDDFRAIDMLLSLNNITIKAFMVSDGTLPPTEGLLKLKALLKETKCDSIPVFQGKLLKNVNPPWRDFNRRISWGAELTNYIEHTIDLNELADIINNSKEPVTMLCLAPLTDVIQLLNTKQNIKSNIEDIIWYNSSAAPLQGFNYECDTASANELFRSGIRINVISNLKNSQLVFDTALYKYCTLQSSRLSKSLIKVHMQPEVYKKLVSRHFMFWDELAAISLINPELFSMAPLPNNDNVLIVKAYNELTIMNVFKDILSEKYKAGEFIVLYGFPIDKNLYTYDIREIMDSALFLYGKEEWKACVLTDEFHGHLGIFSIVGAKMGIKARDYFHVGNDVLTVTSFAGQEEPFSCMNDGIQVSTGATLGQGSISVSDDSEIQPSALFTFNNQSIRITLKDQYLQIIQDDIRQAKERFGLADEAYWFRVRQNAIKYWLSWDRKEIFDIKILD